MKGRLLSIWVLITALMACNKMPNDEQASSKVVELRLVDDKYEVICSKISNEEFAEDFRIGWCCSEVRDVYSDGSLGERNLLLDVSGSFGPNTFAILPDHQLKVYWWRDLQGVDVYGYEYGSYSYDEDTNKLSLIGVDSTHHLTQDGWIDCSFTGGRVLSLTDTEMVVIAPIWLPHESDAGAVFSFFKFVRLSNETIEFYDSRINVSDFED